MHVLLALLAFSTSDELAQMVVGAGAVVLWLRWEHRMTRLETMFRSLPCQRKKPDCIKDDETEL